MTLYLISDEMNFTDTAGCFLIDKFIPFHTATRAEIKPEQRYALMLLLLGAPGCAPSPIELKTVSHTAFTVGQQVRLSVNGAAHIFSQ
ncbi:hypothetical protein KP22_17430 [Pectobacterium betavasculorum]|uniref:Uncharacterized protein n=1 Tax=Pectobacterium betavasculorum TaxID=55207 RepID=A0A093RR51_9GAMM|nr:hypothetical protein KP22_17430 [Pectobacterium betavasculorum]